MILNTLLIVLASEPNFMGIGYSYLIVFLVGLVLGLLCGIMMLSSGGSMRR